jgi:hypothetical protein
VFSTAKGNIKLIPRAVLSAKTKYTGRPIQRKNQNHLTHSNSTHYTQTNITMPSQFSYHRNIADVDTFEVINGQKVYNILKVFVPYLWLIDGKVVSKNNKNPFKQ